MRRTSTHLSSRRPTRSDAWKNGVFSVFVPSPDTLAEVQRGDPKTQERSASVRPRCEGGGARNSPQSSSLSLLFLHSRSPRKPTKGRTSLSTQRSGRPKEPSKSSSAEWWIAAKAQVRGHLLLPQGRIVIPPTLWHLPATSTLPKATTSSPFPYPTTHSSPSSNRSSAALGSTLPKRV